MYTITSFKIDERCLTPGGIQRGEEKGLEMASILPEDRISDLGGNVFIYGGEAKFGPFTVQNILRWGMGEALGDKCFVVLDSEVQMTFNEYWQYGNAYHNYIAMCQDPESFSPANLQAFRPDFERAILVYSAHEVSE